MSAESKVETEELKVAAFNAARESMRKASGPIDRATELFVVLGWSFSGLYLYNGGSDWMMFTVMNATILVVSLLGGVLTAAKPKEAAAQK